MGSPAFCVTVVNEWKTACSKPNLIFSTDLRIYRFLTFIFIIACPPPSPRSKRTETIVSNDRGLRHSWQFVTIPSPSPASDFQTYQIQIEILKWTFSGCYVDPVKNPPSALYDCAKKRQVQPGPFPPWYWSRSRRKFSSCWWRSTRQSVRAWGCLDKTRHCVEKVQHWFFNGKTCFNGTSWKEKTFLCSMSRNLIYGLSVSLAPTPTCQPSFNLP